ncbi:hypothetical protein Bhyg_03637 [Pseudolycoriella hygida]|uniref:Uncharacterized protein n=1 Tax=Pseudolycoriella hygida TaxID=35572 RepID=A0A9Q0NFA5_9DIPT|nr:hypothetical protein Bhyg_03637 [Pseudolycoriella hygida]
MRTGQGSNSSTLGMFLLGIQLLVAAVDEEIRKVNTMIDHRDIQSSQNIGNLKHMVCGHDMLQDDGENMSKATIQHLWSVIGSVDYGSEMLNLQNKSSSNESKNIIPIKPYCRVINAHRMKPRRDPMHSLMDAKWKRDSCLKNQMPMKLLH